MFCAYNNNMHKRIIRLVVYMTIIITLSCQRSGGRDTTLVRTEFMLGTSLVIRVFQGGTDKLIDSVFAKVKEIESTMSVSVKDYEDTDLLKINQLSRTIDPSETFTVPVSHDIATVLTTGIEIARLTDGAFDPTIQPIIFLWGWGTEEQRVPLDSEIKAVLPVVDWTTLSITDDVSSSDGASTMLTLKGQQALDLGGIAKGYAANIARDILVEGGVTSAILDFGGNVVTIGAKEDGSLWKIGIQDPRAVMGNIVVILQLSDTSVVTSGDYERYFEENGIRYSHILDPNTGKPADNGIISVTIICEDSMLADGLSTGVFVLGLEKGLKLVEELEGVSTIIMTEDKNIYVSSDISEARVMLENTEYTLHFTSSLVP